MLQVLNLSAVNLSLVLCYFCSHLPLKVNLKLILFLLAHCRFDESQYDKKVGSCASKGFKFVLKG